MTAVIVDTAHAVFPADFVATVQTHLPAHTMLNRGMSLGDLTIVGSALGMARRTCLAQGDHSLLTVVTSLIERWKQIVA